MPGLLGRAESGGLAPHPPYEVKTTADSIIVRGEGVAGAEQHILVRWCLETMPREPKYLEQLHYFPNGNLNCLLYRVGT